MHEDDHEPNIVGPALFVFSMVVLLFATVFTSESAHPNINETETSEGLNHE